MNRMFVLFALLLALAQSSRSGFADESFTLDIHNFTSHDVSVVICSANGTEQKELTRCLGPDPDTWTLQVSPGHKVISTFDGNGVLLATFPVNVSKPHSHVNSILIFNGESWKPAKDNSNHKGAPPKSFCNGFSNKIDCRP